MKKNLLQKTVAIGLALSTLFAMTACGAQAEKADAAEGSGAKKVTFAYRNTGTWPIYGEDENGNPTGYDIEVLKEVDKLLPDYEFEYVGTSYDDAYIGMEAGNYDAALTNAFWTEEREQKYLISEQNLGASVLILVKTAENDAVKNLTDLHNAGLELAPLLAGNGMYYVVKQYNDDNPDAQVEIKTTDDSTYVAGSVEEVVAGKYDAAIFTKPQFEASVIAEDGDLHEYLDKISYSEFTLAKTYPMFSRNLGEDFLKAYNDALVEVVKSGKASELSNQFLDYDIFNYKYE
ncbi:MAG: transporter substrate-binding domain-containing protein [Butyrivibrio sp.]|nr:transporter substrate-binding domain-containing protein [Butyrivibrio sp.]